MLKTNRIVKQEGFTLIEILIALIVIGALAAAGIGGYYMVFGATDTASIVQNVQKLKVMADQYASMNSGTFNGITAASMQQDGLLPAGWTIYGGQWANPPNQSRVWGYYINQNVLGLNEAFDIGFQGTNNDITNNIAKNICNDFEDQITGFQYNGTVYSITTGGTNCNNIPANSSTAPNDQLILGFE
jgi:prepilin-type N-terminal cleavage/methylation domain-containing protein